MLSFFNKQHKTTAATTPKVGNGSKDNDSIPAKEVHPEAPFTPKDPNRTDILIRGMNSDSDYGNASAKAVLEMLVKDHIKKGAKKMKVQSKDFFYQVKTDSLNLPGYQLISMNMKRQFSRMRNVPAENWYDEAHEKADAFVYIVNIEDQEVYLNKRQQGQRPGWEHDRFLLSRSFLQKPTMVENSSKPLLLLVNDDCFSDDFEIGRVVNLLGLGGRLSRPFRAISYSTLDTNNLKEGLAWLKRTATNVDEATAFTASETEDEASIGTQESNTAMFSTKDDEYVLDYQPTLVGGNPTLQRFQTIQNGTFCPFAKAAKLWGGKLPDTTQPQLHKTNKQYMEEVATLNAGPLAAFVARVNDGDKLDGFCVEIPHSSYVNVETLGKNVCCILAKLAELDPYPGENAMKMGPIE